VLLDTEIDYSYSEQFKAVFEHTKESIKPEKMHNIIAFGDPDLIYTLRYGPGRLRSNINFLRRKYDPYQYTNYTDVQEIIQEIRPFETIEHKIVFSDINFNPDDEIIKKSALIAVNGVLQGDEVSLLESISPSDITNLKISTSLSDIHRYTPLDFAAVIEITTIQNMYRYRRKPIRVLSDILNPVREFYSPDYSVESITSDDQRKTLYWNPQMRVEKNKPIIITFFTSDLKGPFYGRAEGMDSEGNPISGAFGFIVTE